MTCSSVYVLCACAVVLLFPLALSQSNKTFRFHKFPMKMNHPPTIKNKFTKLVVTAGKVFSVSFPPKQFFDLEDGENLKLTMYDVNNTKIGANSWLQLLPDERIVYGLPLESHARRWEYIIEARDSTNLYVRGILDITVKSKNKTSSNVNHLFTITLNILQFFNAVDWQIKVIENIVQLYGDKNKKHVTVLEASQTDFSKLTWTNDTLHNDHKCPMNEILTLWKVLSDEEGSPSSHLLTALLPEIQLVEIELTAADACRNESLSRWAYPREGVDSIACHVGHLFVFKIPVVILSNDAKLKFINNSNIPEDYWLQYDAGYQELYGLPGPADVKSVHYILIAIDPEGVISSYKFVVEVMKGPTIEPSVQFRMTLDCPYKYLAYNASNKRRLIEKLGLLFGESNTNNIRVANITDSPTTIIWYNISLPMNKCPRDEIEELKVFFQGPGKKDQKLILKDVVDVVFEKDMKVMTVSVVPMGICADNHRTNTTIITNYAEVSASQDGGENKWWLWRYISYTPKWSVHAYSDTATGVDTVFWFLVPSSVLLVVIPIVFLLCLSLYVRRLQGPAAYPRVKVTSTPRRACRRANCRFL